MPSSRLARLPPGVPADSPHRRRTASKLCSSTGLAAGIGAHVETTPIGRVLAARALRSFADGFIAVVLPAYLLALGHGQLEVGLISTATLAGSALATLAVGRWGKRFSIRRLLLAASLATAPPGMALARPA